VIEDEVFIGSDTQLVAPVKVGRGSVIAAGTTITQDVPPNSLAISRTVQVNRVGWASKRLAWLAGGEPGDRQGASGKGLEIKHVRGSRSEVELRTTNGERRTSDSRPSKISPRPLAPRLLPLASKTKRRKKTGGK
jgi:hypothetical protein